MNEALSLHIWIFFNPQLFLFRFKIFPVHTKRMQIKFADMCVHVVPEKIPSVRDPQPLWKFQLPASFILFLKVFGLTEHTRTFQSLLQESMETRPTCCATYIGLLFGKTLDTILLCRQTENIQIRRRQVIRFVINLFFPLKRAD